MKNLVITLSLAFLATVALANNDKYIAAMKSGIESLNQAQTVEALQNAIQKFERIAQAEKDKWEPQYYAAYGYVKISEKTEDPGEKDEILNTALELVNNGLEMAPEEAELEVMKGYIRMQQLTVDPMTRGAQYSGMSFSAYNKALALSPGNPRALTMLAFMEIGTAQFMGSSTAKGCATMQKAYDAYATYTTDNELAPKWGIRSAEYGLKSCNQTETASE